MYGSEEILICKLLSTQAVGVRHLYLHDVVEITNGQPWQNLSYSAHLMAKTSWVSVKIFL
jgi:hypothetical protein